MVRLFSLTCILVLVLAASAGASLQAKYLQTCGLANIAKDDPLVNPGLEGGADHAHAEFGAKNWNASTTTGDFLSGGTTCILPTNKTAYWVPEIVAPNGTLVAPTSTGGYYGAFGADPTQIAGGKVYPFPQGIRFIVGNPKSTVLQSTSVVKWRCDAASNPTLGAPPKTCPSGQGIELIFISPPCWDGINLDSADHHSHMRTSLADGSCPADHHVRVPLLNWSFHYPSSAFAGSNGTVAPMLTSDHGTGPAGRTAHMDLWEAQDAMGQALLTQCLNDPARSSSSSPLCGLFTYVGGVNGVAPNGWLANLNAWNAKLDYIAGADGNPAPR